MISKLQSDLQKWDSEVSKMRGTLETQRLTQQSITESSDKADLRSRLVEKDR